MLPKRDVAEHVVLCPNDDCPGLDDYGQRSDGAVLVHWDEGRWEVIADMPKCPACGTEMKFYEDVPDVKG